jgi:hypothetical protein
MGPFSVARCQTLIVRFATFSIAVSQTDTRLDGCKALSKVQRGDSLFFTHTLQQPAPAEGGTCARNASAASVEESWVVREAQ